MPVKKRNELYDLFAAGNKPTHDDFVDLIDSAINIGEDGIGISEKGKPMEIVQQGSKRRLLDFSSDKDTPLWRIGAISDDGARNGLNIASANCSRLFINQETGFTGINNDNPVAKLHLVSNSQTALRVDGAADNPLFVIEADGSVGIGADAQESYKVAINGKVHLQDEVTIDNLVHAKKGLTVENAALTAERGISVQNGVTVETGLLEAKAGLTVNGKILNANAGASVNGALLDVNNGLTVANGAIIETGKLEAKGGVTVSGSALETNDGLTVHNGAVIESGKLEAKAGLVISGDSARVNNGITVNNGAVIESGIFEAKNGAVISGGVLQADDGLIANNGAIIASGKLEAKAGAAISGDLLEANNGLTVWGKTTFNNEAVIETGLLTAKGGLAVNGSALNADGAVTLGNPDTGEVTIDGKLHINNAVTIANNKLLAEAGALVSGSGLVAANGLTVHGGATFDTGMLAAESMNIDGPVTLGNAATGVVTVNGLLKATNGLEITGSELVAQKGISITGNLNAPDTATLGNVTMNTLSVSDITVSGTLGLKTVDLQSLSANNASVQALTSGKLTVSGLCQANDNLVLTSGMIYATYQGPSSSAPRLKIQKGTVAGARRDGTLYNFNFSIDDAKQVTVIYNDRSSINNFINDWDDYKPLQPDKTDGFNFTRVGTSSWDINDMEIVLISPGTEYPEYLITDRGLRIIYTGSLSGTPQFEIKANENNSAKGFEFTINGLMLTIKYPSDDASRSVNRLLLDWQIWKSNGMIAVDEFEIQQTADTGNLQVTGTGASLETNAAHALFYKGRIKTNTLSIGGYLKFADSPVLINKISDNDALAESSNTILPTQKAVKAYIDNGLSAVNTILGTKANQQTVDNLNTVLGTKASQQAVDDINTILRTKANQQAVDDLNTALGTKANQQAVDDLNTALGTKANQQAVNDLNTALGTKANQQAVNDLNTALGTKAGSQKLNVFTISYKSVASIADIILTAGSRGLLMVQIKKNADSSILGNGLFAVHGMGTIFMLAGSNMTDQPDSSNCYNVYYDGTNMIVQNTATFKIIVTCTYFGD